MQADGEAAGAVVPEPQQVEQRRDVALEPRGQLLLNAINFAGGDHGAIDGELRLHLELWVDGSPLLGRWQGRDQQFLNRTV